MSRPLPGDFGLVATNHGNLIDRVASAAIRFGTNSIVNHAFIYIGDGRIVEARRRVEISPVSEYGNIIWSTGRLGRLTPDPDQRRGIVAAARSYVGESYNWADIVAIALAQKRLGELIDVNHPPWWVERVSNDGRLICSQTVDAAYRKAGVHLFADNRLPGLVSPGDLLNLLYPAA